MHLVVVFLLISTFQSFRNFSFIAPTSFVRFFLSRPEVTLCGWQDVKNHGLTPLPIFFSILFVFDFSSLLNFSPTETCLITNCWQVKIIFTQSEHVLHCMIKSEVCLTLKSINSSGEFTYIIFTGMLGESYLYATQVVVKLCLCDVFRALIKSRVC